MTKFKTPRPRRPVSDPALSRPNWLAGDVRDPEMLWLDKNENIDPELARLTTKILHSLPAHAAFAYPEPGGAGRPEWPMD